ncbi:MAG TPA: hypothetical protein VIH00_02175, partial [Candidatus Limnocylindrales bacterium]
MSRRLVGLVGLVRRVTGRGSTRIAAGGGEGTLGLGFVAHEAVGVAAEEVDGWAAAASQGVDDGRR